MDRGRVVEYVVISAYLKNNDVFRNPGLVKLFNLIINIYYRVEKNLQPRNNTS